MKELLQLIRHSLPPWPSLWRCALTGAFGIASGFAVFVLWLDEISRGPYKFVVALVVAVLVSFTFESLREELEGRRQRWYVPRLLVLVVLLTMAELFVMGFHSMVLVTPTRLRDTLESLLGAEVQEWHAIAIIAVWLVLGAAIAVGLGATIFKASCEIPEDEPLSWDRPAVWGKPMLRSAVRGGLTGALAGPMCMLTYIFAVRFTFEYQWILKQHDKWQEHLRGALQKVEQPGWTWFVWLPTKAIQLLDHAFSVFGQFGPLLTLIVLIALLTLCARLQAERTFFVLLAAVALVYIYPLFSESTRTLRLAGLMAYIWAVPGLLLGAITPWLKRPSGYPKLWGVVAFGAAGVLVIGALAVPWFIAPAIVFGALGLWFRRGVAVEQYWAVLALSVATNVFGATHLVARADFFHIQQDSFALTTVPLKMLSYQPPQPFRPFGGLSYLDPTAVLPHQLPDTALLPLMPGSTPLTSPWPSIVTSPSWSRGLPLPVTPAPDPESVIAADIARVKAEHQRAERARVDFARHLNELLTIQERIGKGRETLDALKKGEYYERYGKLTALAAWIPSAEADRKSIVDDASTALAGERSKTIPGLDALTSGIMLAILPRVGTQARLDVLRDEQRQLESEKQKFLDTLQQVKDLGDALTSPLSELGKAVVHDLADLHNAALTAFEVALTASSGFWITLGLLASWSIQREQVQKAPHSG
jgi:hypothetical protein